MEMKRKTDGKSDGWHCLHFIQDFQVHNVVIKWEPFSHKMELWKNAF